MKKIIIAKKAQVTIFAIIAIIILITGILLFVVKKEEATTLDKEPHKPEFAGQTELKNYVDSCLQDVALQGLEIIRLQGGYVDVPDNVDSLTAKDTEGKYVRNLDGSKNVVIDPNSENKLPYWLTAESVAIPSLSFMEKELENYITKGLETCVNDFKDFRDQGFTVNYSSIEANVAMGKAVVVNIDFPISLRKADTSFEENSFVFSVPIDMELIQKTASDLTALEDFHTYLEDHTKNLISLYSGVSEDKLPPFSRSTTNFDCSFTTWNKQDVKNRLKNVLDFNIPNLKVEGTSFTQPSSNSQFQGVYDSFVYDLFLEEFPNLKVDFIYENEWEFLDYDIIPNNGNFLRPERVVGTNIPLLPQICVFKYPFKYSVQYPVLVKITDTSSAKIDPVANAYFKDKGFTFQFPMVAYLCGNQNRKCNRGNLPVVDTTSFTVANTTILPQTLFCNPEQRISNELTIKTFDSLTSSSLGKVDVNYYCGSFQNDCFIGRTDADGILKTKFPLCINGQIYFTKNGYSVLSQDLTTHELPKSEFSHFLNPDNNVKVGVKKVYVPAFVRNYFETNSLSLGNAEQNLVLGEMVTIVSDTGLFYIYPDPGERDLQIGSRNYKLDLQLTADVEIKDTFVNGEKVPGFSGKYPIGSLSTETFVSKEDLTKETVTFYVLAEYNKDNLNPASLNEIDDAILTENGTMEAELWYSCEKAGETCNFDVCSFIDIDGRNLQDFSDNPDTCEKTFNVTITKEQYEDLVKPIFS